MTDHPDLPIATGARIETTSPDMGDRTLEFTGWTEDAEGRELAVFTPEGDADWGLPLYPPAVENHLNTTWNVLDDGTDEDGED